MEKKGRNASSLKVYNRALLLNIIRKNRGISRIELAKMTGLTKGGITPIISDLLRLKIIRECGTFNTPSGRRPVGLEINPHRFSVIALDFKRVKYTLGLVNFGGEIEYVEEYQYRDVDTFENIFEQMFSSIYDLLIKNEGKKIIGIGVTAPGPLDYKNGVIVCPPNFFGMENIPIKRIFQEKFNLPVYLDNNANAFALAEKHYGSAKDYRDFIYLAVDEGIGAGVVINETIYRGRGGFGSEIGHTTIDINGPRCSCGNYGCVELYASVPNLVKRIDSAVASGRSNSAFLSRIRAKRPLEWNDVLKGLNLGDPVCREHMEKEAEYLGAIIVTAVNLLEPQAVIIGSKLSACGEHILNPLKKYVYARSVTRNIHKPDLYASNMSYGALVGGATMVINHFVDGDLGEYEEIL
ncbi:ROK family transcriptional regulator [Thermosediminibacter litoriperuensis]|uniref:Putative NBD/HSP70 family sugar kinase n=1 Tax=Thermosediminibacter litoriperuensis TaxID=291989 RepID=A0A5S5AFA2_9FIRM|nr:ROK family transcriptional regulator [Thermosediminibacter litoriperuensis]TYP48721.1 putative NBD/HSP70 family sugar kinase [Thermosediminibacter litoriperuensis]